MFRDPDQNEQKMMLDAITARDRAKVLQLLHRAGVVWGVMLKKLEGKDQDWYLGVTQST